MRVEVYDFLKGSQGQERMADHGDHPNGRITGGSSRYGQNEDEDKSNEAENRSQYQQDSNDAVVLVSEEDAEENGMGT